MSIQIKRINKRSELQALAQDLSGKAGPTMDNQMTKDERRDLHHESTTLAYEWIKLTGLSALLTNEQADELADQIATRVDREIEARVDERLTQIQAEQERVEQERLSTVSEG